jgi:HTH-type transcriptional regulator, competence development regulator
MQSLVYKKEGFFNFFYSNVIYYFGEGLITVEFGRYINTLRIKKGLSIRELSRRSGVSQPYISQIESGDRGVPKPDKLRDLAPHLDVSYTELMKKAGHIDEDKLTDEEESFLGDIHLTPEELDEKYDLVIDGNSATKEEIRIAIETIRLLRSTYKKEG